MTWLADEKDVVEDPVTQATAYLTSQHNGLHFGGRRRDRGGFQVRQLFQHTHAHTVPEGLAASLLYIIWSL